MDRFEFEIRASRSRFESEASRRDSVRSSMAIPLAAMSFAAFGFGAIVRNLIFAPDTPMLQYLSFWGLALALAALFLFISALTVFRKIDYVGYHPYPEALDVETQYDEMRRELANEGLSPREADEIANRSAWEFARDSYMEAAVAQERKNHANLTYQSHMLSYLLWGLGCLICALAVTGVVQLLKDMAG